MNSKTTEKLRQAWLARQDHFDPRAWLLWAVINVMFVIFIKHLLTFLVILLIQLILTMQELSVKRVMGMALGLVIPTIVLLSLNVFLFNLGLVTTLLLTSKFWLMILVFSWVYSKVDPDEFLMVLESLRMPSVLAWQFSVAYRQVPFMFRKSRNLYEILISRGVPLDRGIFHAARDLPSFLVPLLVQVHEDASQLSEAMICRGWHPEVPLSRVLNLELKKKDLGLMMGMLFHAIMLIIIDFLLLVLNSY